jgi:MraZ protein
MFIGRYYHNLQPKGRLAIPSSFRSQLTSSSVITAGLDGALFVFPASSWKKLTAKLASLPLTKRAARLFTRSIIQSASELNLDSQGRTLIPSYLRELASINKQVVVAGALTRIEIWDKERYHKHLNVIAKQINLEDQLESLLI